MVTFIKGALLEVHIILKNKDLGNTETCNEFFLILPNYAGKRKKPPEYVKHLDFFYCETFLLQNLLLFFFNYNI